MGKQCGVIETVKDIFRHALGVIFLFFFLLFLFLTAIRFEVLAPKFWTTSFAASGVYRELTSGIGVLQEKIDAGMGKGVLELRGVVTEERLQQAIEENISRLLSYIQGSSKELMLYFPLREWGFPQMLLNDPMLKGLSRDTKVATALAGLGMKPEAVQQTVLGLGTVQQYMRFLPVAWFVLLVIVVGLGIAYYSLGVGTARFTHLGLLFTLSGCIAGIIGLSATVIGAFVLRGTSVWPVWGRELGVQLVTQFFSLGKIIGFAVAAAGIVILFAANKLFQSGKKKEAKESMKRQIIKFVTGIVLGSIVLTGSAVGLVVALGGTVNFSLNSQGKGASQTGGRYVSKSGWSIMPPAGWALQEDVKFVQFTKKSSSANDPWAYIQIRAVERYPSVDQGTYVAIAKDGILSGKAGFAKAVFLMEPKEDVWHEWKRITLYFDSDDPKLGRVRLLRWQLYPKTSGNGWTILAAGSVKSWSMFDRSIQSSLDSFEAQ